jgi:hypothetical protein
MRGKAVIAAATSAVLLFSGAALAQAVVYTWTGMGTNVPGSAKCATYRLTVDVTVEGNAVKGVLKQQGRPERTFQATKDAKGAFKAKAELADGGNLDVTGSIAADEGRLLIDGYCKFEGKLTPK